MLKHGLGMLMVYLWDYLSLTCISSITCLSYLSVYVLTHAKKKKGNSQKFSIARGSLLSFFPPRRVSPSVPFTSRTLDKDTVLGDYTLSKGVSISLLDLLATAPYMNSSERSGSLIGSTILRQHPHRNKTD